MENKTQTQTYNFLLENKSIEDIKKQPNIEVKEIKNKRHSGKTYRIDKINNQQLNEEQVQNIDENLEIVTTNEKDQETNNDILTKLKNFLTNSNTEEISKLQTTIHNLKRKFNNLKKKIKN